MANFTVITNYGYFKDSQDRIVAKYHLPNGSHPLKDGYTAVEVADESAMNAVVTVDEELTADEQRTQKIRNEVFKLAEKSLKDKGEIQ